MVMSMSPHSYVVEAGSDSAARPLVLLHGSSGNESDLLSLAARLAPNASRLGVRGTIPSGEGYAFFRRDAARRVDEADIRTRVPALADLLSAFRRRMGQAPITVGYSNGAIMAAALLASDPGLLAGAVLFRPLSPFLDDDSYRRAALPVLIVDGAQDSRRSPGDGHGLAQQLSGAGVAVTHRVLPVGHAITPEDEAVAREWLQSLPALD